MTTKALNTIDLHPCISNKEKGNVCFFLIRFETEMERKTYTIMLVRPKDDKRAIYHWSTARRFEWGKRKCLFFPYSLWNGVGQKYIYHYACKTKRLQRRNILLIYLHEFGIRKNEKGDVSFFLIAMKRHWTKHIYHSASTCKANRRQTHYIPLLYLHEFRIRKKEKGNVSLFLICFETTLNRKTYTRILVRLKDDKRAIHHWSTSMHFEKRKGKYFLFPYSLWNGVG